MARRVLLFIFGTGHEAEDPVRIAGAPGLEAFPYLGAAALGVGMYPGDLRVGLFGSLRRGFLGGGTGIGALARVYLPRASATRHSAPTA